MSTRACVSFYLDKNHIASVYHHFDGYPQGVGQELVEFLKSKPFVNGIGKNRNVFNGAGCFIAQYIKHFKRGPGGVNVRQKWTRGTEAWEEYVYKVTFSEDDSFRICSAVISMLKGHLPKSFPREIRL